VVNILPPNSSKTIIKMTKAKKGLMKATHKTTAKTNQKTKRKTEAVAKKIKGKGCLQTVYELN